MSTSESDMHTHASSGSDRPRVLVIEDEQDLREAIVTYLNTEPVSAQGAATLAEASAWCEADDFDILILDLGLPDGDGMRWLRETTSVRQKGVLILTARGLPAQRIDGLKAGADAYLVKPVALEELALQVQNLFARIGVSADSTTAQPRETAKARPGTGGWRLNATTWMLTSPNGKSLLLKHTEKALLQALMKPAGEVLSKERIIDTQGGRADSYDYRRVETLIRRLRTRCREALDTELPVQTIYGRGLAFTEPGSVVQSGRRPADEPLL